MKRFAASVLLVTLCIAGLSAQAKDEVVLAYRRNFARASLVTKLELLKEASARQDKSMGPLYDMAIRYVVDNALLLAGDLQLKQLALLAAAEAGKTAYSGAVDNLLALFQSSQDSEVRAAALTALGFVGRGESRVAESLGAFLASQNSLFRSGAQPEYPALVACIGALGTIGDGASFPVLFSAYVAGYKPDITASAAKALGSIKGDYEGYLLQVIAKNPPLEKAAAFSAGMSNPNFDGAARGSLAEGALAAALTAGEEQTIRSPVELQALHDLRMAAVRELETQRWQRASPLVIQHFRLLLADYAKGAATKKELLDAVACLGAMGSSEAAQVLAIQLQLINVQTEQGTPYDDELVLAMVKALGQLGDKIAFDYLLQISYLSYSDDIKQAARQSLLALKW